jgi:hypothetical protein
LAQFTQHLRTHLAFQLRQLVLRFRLLHAALARNRVFERLDLARVGGLFGFQRVDGRLQLGLGGLERLGGRPHLDHRRRRLLHGHLLLRELGLVGVARRLALAQRRLLRLERRRRLLGGGLHLRHQRLLLGQQPLHFGNQLLLLSDGALLRSDSITLCC